MKTLVIIVILFITCSCSAQKSKLNEVNLDNSIIAKMENGKSYFVVDTIKLKMLLEKNIPDNFKIKIKSLKIVYGQTTGDKIEDFYLLVAEDTKTNKKVGKPLTLQNEHLQFSNASVYDRLLVVCEGSSPCIPNVTIVNSIKSLICGEPKECLIPGTCSMSKILIQ